ncbi:MAG TPA: toprim domain-containing protein, partial [Desulfobulbaceae bacterium]|nr:toprim domain-containing protein [Desulfobulbaceae bacterium]
DGETITRLKELGILNKKGREHFYGCATFPLYDCNDNPVGMYSRRVYAFEKDNIPSHLYLPGPRKGVFNRHGVKSGSEIHLTESILDALSLINAGIRNTIPCYGVGGLTDDILHLLMQEKPERIYVCFDGDEAGYTGAKKVRERLARAGLTAHVVKLPEMYDLNIFFNPQVTGKGFTDSKRAYEELYMGAAGLTPPVKPGPQEEYIPRKDGFALIRDKRRYEVRAISKNGRNLKATVKGISINISGQRTEDRGRKNKTRFHVDTVDFYSARSRAYLTRGLADLFGTDEKTIGRDMEKMIESAENYLPREQAGPETRVIAEKDKQEALAFLKNPDLLTEIITDLETVGYTGEEMNKLLCYIAAISRKTDDPLSVMIQSRSAAGKSCLQDAVLSLIPDEDFIKYTRLTDQALFYQGGSLAHKILAIEELDGMNGAMYSIRTIQSSKKITIAYTGKDPVSGKMKTEENTVEGPLMVFITTTEAEIDGETASRFLFISIDESREMTEKILAKQRHSHTMEGFLGKLKGADIIRKHKNAGRLLKKPLKVVNPYAELLTFTSKSLRARRDHTKYLNLIQAIAYLFQYQRKIHTVDYGGKTIEYINVTLTDIARANELAAEILGRSLDELSPPSRKLLMLIKEMCVSEARGQGKEREKEKEKRFTRRDIREYSGWSDFQVKTHIKQLEELEYIYSTVGRKGKEYVYELVYTGG